MYIQKWRSCTFGLLHARTHTHARTHARTPTHAHARTHAHQPADVKLSFTKRAYASIPSFDDCHFAARAHSLFVHTRCSCTLGERVVFRRTLLNSIQWKFSLQEEELTDRPVRYTIIMYKALKCVYYLELYKSSLLLLLLFSLLLLLLLPLLSLLLLLLTK